MFPYVEKIRQEASRHSRADLTTVLANCMHTSEPTWNRRGCDGRRSAAAAMRDVHCFMIGNAAVDIPHLRLGIPRLNLATRKASQPCRLGHVSLTSTMRRLGEPFRGRLTLACPSLCDASPCGKRRFCARSRPTSLLADRSRAADARAQAVTPYEANSAPNDSFLTCAEP
eukprot:6183525-Pleurochrysis_carterae.AAC.2